MFISPNKIIEGLGLSGKEIVADFGAGSGAYIFPISKQLENKGGEVYAIDIQSNVLKRLSNSAKQLGLKNIHFLHADVESQNGTKLKDGNVDLVIISNLLHQVSKRKTTIQEALRIVHDSAHVLIIDWKESYRSMGPAKEDDCLKMCLELGMSLDKVLSAGSHHYALLFRKNITIATR